MAIDPDTKDWTWVLGARCPQCGLSAGEFPPVDVADRVRADLPRWVAVLGRPDASDRPDAETWSPTEYGCHVRDVFYLFSERVRLIVDEDQPRFGNWNQDETAVDDHYEGQHPTDVADQLVRAGAGMADTLDNVPDDAWDRRGVRSDGAIFTTATLTQYFLHDVVHHLEHDVNG
jgi:DinB superfamily